MSKGKKGELKATEIFSVIGQKEKSLDFTRHTTTNTADNGSDIFLKVNHKFIPKFKEIAVSGDSKIICGDEADITVRIDVKNNQKVGKDDAEKFIDDVKKHPRSQTHLILGNAFTSGAKQVLKKGQNSYPHKTIEFIDKEGLTRIENFYRQLPDYPDED